MRFTPPSRQTLRAPLLLGLLCAAIAGCGSGKAATDTAASTAERPAGISFAAGSAIKPRDPRAAVQKRLDQEPVLTASPTKDLAGGCDFYAMEMKPLADVWQVCYDEKEQVSLVVTQLSSSTEPPAPAGASPAREALIARADTICQSENAKLATLTKELGKALNELGAKPTEGARRKTAALIGKFNDILTETVPQLSAFDAPTDEATALSDYLAALEDQTAVLAQAQKALLAGAEDRYVELGTQFDKLGKSAADLAKQYGFSVCSASTFS